MAAPMVPCPRCKRTSPFAPSNPSRPFCSERCKQIDLGAWATEQYRVAVESTDEETGADGDADTVPSTRPPERH